MKRSITRVGLTFASAALLAMLASCSRQSQPAQPTPSPTFEPGMEPPPPPAAPQAPTAPTAPGAPQGGQAPMPPQPQSEYGQGMEEQPYGQPEQGAQGAGQPAMTMSEREACDALKRDSRINVEDVQGGVAIVMRPKRGAELSGVRENARMIERHMSQGGPRSPSAQQCALFDLAAPGVMTSLTEGADSVRLILTTSDAAKTRTLRKQARDFAKAKSGAAPQQQAPRR